MMPLHPRSSLGRLIAHVAHILHSTVKRDQMTHPEPRRNRRSLSTSSYPYTWNRTHSHAASLSPPIESSDRGFMSFHHPRHSRARKYHFRDGGFRKEMNFSLGDERRHPGCRKSRFTRLVLHHAKVMAGTRSAADDNSSR